VIFLKNWDDAQFILALARCSTIRAAGKSLNINHTTVSRRIRKIEKNLSTRLFEKTSSGYITTPSGQIMYEAAKKIEDLIVSVEKQINGADMELAGDVYISIPDIFDTWVCEHFSKVFVSYPKLTIHLKSEIKNVDLAKREADIALRITQYPPEDMIGKKIATIPIAVYANSSFEVDPTKPLSSYPWVRWDSKFRDSQVEKWTESASVGAPSVTRVNTYKSLSMMIKSGYGIGCLSPWFADYEPNLKKVSSIIEEASMDVWILTHPDLRGVKRIQKCKDVIISIFDDI